MRCCAGTSVFFRFPDICSRTFIVQHFLQTILPHEHCYGSTEKWEQILHMYFLSISKSASPPTDGAPGPLYSVINSLYSCEMLSYISRFLRITLLCFVVFSCASIASFSSGTRKKRDLVAALDNFRELQSFICSYVRFDFNNYNFRSPITIK